MAFGWKTFLLMPTLLTLGVLMAYYAIAYFDPLQLWSLSPPKDMGPHWWGPAAEKQRSNKEVKLERFTVSFTDERLADLKRRLADTVYPAPLEGVHFEYGYNVDHLRTVVVDHWLNKYNWTQQQAWLNSFDHWTTRIDGLRVHFVRSKPAKPRQGVKVLPLMLVHGWPGSFVEFLDMLPLLTTTMSNDNFVFEVVIPSIPGFGFSEAAHRPGLGPVETARMFDTLMQRLGHDAYYVQGGDWGSRIATNMAQLFPQRVKGVHVNLVFEQNVVFNVKVLVGRYVPWLVGIDEADYGRLYPLRTKFFLLLQEFGFFHIQATKPDTVGLGLANSPAALAAYILEKFSTCTDQTGVHSWDGKLTAKFSLDRLLTNVMVYWMSGCITSSVRFYKEHFSATQMAYQMDRVPVRVPAGAAAFPNELQLVTRLSARSTFEKLVSFTDMPRGGHFAAFEEPQLLADDIKRFVRIVEHSNEQQATSPSRNADRDTF